MRWIENKALCKYDGAEEEEIFVRASLISFGIREDDEFKTVTKRKE